MILLQKKLGVTVPEVDFPRLASELKELENRFIQARLDCERIENPRILCAASEQYTQPGLGFNLDVAVLEKTFPKCVEIETNLTGKRLRYLLTTQHFDILHLVLAVDPDNGDLIFSPIDFSNYKPTRSSPDRMTAGGFADLLSESNTKLVVLATCHSLLLAVEVSKFANMAASDRIISGKQAEEWEDCFYGLLAQGKPLFKAFDITKSQSSAPIRAIRHKDVVFTSHPIG